MVPSFSAGVQPPGAGAATGPAPGWAGTVRDMAVRRRPTHEIAADLRAAIEAGELPPGSRLPSRAALAERYGVAELTVTHAMTQLRHEGLITSRAGAGSYVRGPQQLLRASRLRLSRAERVAGRGTFATDAHSGGWTARSDVEVRTERADATVAGYLGIGEGDEVLVRDRVMYADDEPVQLATSYLPAELATGAMAEPDSGPGGIYARLEDAGHVLTHYEETVRVGRATESEAAALRTTPGTPLLRLVRRAHTATRVVEVNLITMLGERFELHYEAPAE